MRFPISCVFGILLSIVSAGADQVHPTFLEIDGVVSIEAEHFTENVGPWYEVEGRNATAAGQGLTKDIRLKVVDTQHPIARGLPSEIQVAEAIRWNWGIPNGNAARIAELGANPSRSAIFAYEKGAMMPGLPAPARRVSIFYPSEGLPDTLWKTFEAAMCWAAGENSPASKPVLFIIGNSEQLSRSDALTKAHIERSGWKLKTVSAPAIQEVDTATHSLVLISDSVRVEHVEGIFRTVPIPVVVGKSYLLHPMGMVLTNEVQSGGNAMQIASGRWNDHLRYAIHFSNPGIYHLWLYGRSGGDGGADEVKVFFNTETISSAATNFFEIRFSATNGWTDLMHYRTPENRKTRGTPTITVTQPGWHNLYLVRGSEPEAHGGVVPKERLYPNWRVDKIALFRDSNRKPEGEGPAETFNNGKIPVPLSFQKYAEFLPSQIWRVENGAAVIEAEAIDHHEFWMLKTEPRGFTGDGYLEWRGPGRTQTIEGHYGNDDYSGVRQGPQEERLILRLEVDEPGRYRVDVRNHHLREDGDNDTWIAKIGAKATPQQPIVRLGDSLKDGTGFSWLDWGVRGFDLHKGENQLFIGGRSIGFGIDRIAIYRDGDEKAKERALNLKSNSSLCR